MNFDIVKAQSKKEINAVFDGEAPHYHPDDFWNTRLDEQRVFIAKRDSKNIGLLCYTVWWGNTPFLELVHIQDDFQRQGIGRALLKEAAKDIQSKKLKHLISSSEAVNNLGNNFHQGCNFEKLNTLALPHGEEQFYSIELEKLT